MSTILIVIVARCATCERELGRTIPFPATDKFKAGLAAPFGLRTDCGHSAFSDLNWHYTTTEYAAGAEPPEDRWWEPATSTPPKELP